MERNERDQSISRVIIEHEHRTCSATEVNMPPDLSHVLDLIEGVLFCLGFSFDPGSLSVEISNKDGGSRMISSGDVIW